MSKASKYSPSTNFNNQQQSQGTVQGVNMDVEYNNLQNAINDNADKQDEIRRADSSMGNPRLNNQIIWPETLTPSVVNLITLGANNESYNIKGEWTIGALYSKFDVVSTATEIPGYGAAVNVEVKDSSSTTLSTFQQPASILSGGLTNEVITDADGKTVKYTTGASDSYEGTGIFLCLVDHTASASFADDLATGFWFQIGGNAVTSKSGGSGTTPGYLVGTGIIDGGVLTITGTDTVNISAGKGIIADFYTIPGSVEYTLVEWESLDVTITDLASSLATALRIDASGNVIQTPNQPTAEQRRDAIFIGLAVHTNGVSLVTTNDIQRVTPAYDVINHIQDFWRVVGFIKEGVTIQGNSAGNLLLDRLGGQVSMMGINFKTERADPNTKPYDPETAISSYVYLYRDGAGGFTIATESTMDPTMYDNGSGTLQTVPAGNATSQWVFWSPRTNIVYVHYGQAIYPSLVDAAALWASEPVQFESALLSEAIFLGTVLTVQSATDLTDINEASLINSDKFGQKGVGGGSTISLPLAISEGGTGATTEAEALTNLGAEPADTDILKSDESATLSVGFTENVSAYTSNAALLVSNGSLRTVDTSGGVNISLIDGIGSIRLNLKGGGDVTYDAGYDYVFGFYDTNKGMCKVEVVNDGTDQTIQFVNSES